ncbi:hypothetical protein GSI_08463 [Ganoderma sinense ZZ0214-1]|uniref:Uncharacterized protein n=1 Tax=Ganoderma sinense ZZ0214-1 TaxID=1077348 RepID=A0A2G8S3S9_9APHY|nr:hypothetical protein GSI_08463 [Ganoderma sinense ZZ0214-1]
MSPHWGFHPLLCDSAWITHDGAAVPVIVTGGLTDTSHPFLNDAEAGYGVEIQVTENNGHNALLQYTIELSYPDPRTSTPYVKLLGVPGTA